MSESALTIEREDSGRPKGHTGPYRFGFAIKVSGPVGGADTSRRARFLALTDARLWCEEKRAGVPVFQFESEDNGFTETGRFIYTVFFGTALMLGGENDA